MFDKEQLVMILKCANVNKDESKMDKYQMKMPHILQLQLCFLFEFQILHFLPGTMIFDNYTVPIAIMLKVTWMSIKFSKHHHAMQ